MYEGGNGAPNIMDIVWTSLNIAVARGQHNNSMDSAHYDVNLSSRQQYIRSRSSTGSSKSCPTLAVSRPIRHETKVAREKLTRDYCSFVLNGQNFEPETKRVARTTIRCFGNFIRVVGLSPPEQCMASYDGICLRLICGFIKRTSISFHPLNRIFFIHDSHLLLLLLLLLRFGLYRTTKQQQVNHHTTVSA